MSWLRYLIATRSAGKLRELNQIFGDFKVRVVDLSGAGIPETSGEDDLECFTTFEENAVAKARYFHLASRGMPTFADDSGLVVDALGGEPGVISKRWSGRPDLTGAELDAANNAKLLSRMAAAREANPGVADTGRYVSVAVYKDGDYETLVRGEVEGRILAEPRGAGGFGYDAYFEAPELGGTFAESSVALTASRGHRGRAFRALLSALRADGRL